MKHVLCRAVAAGFGGVSLATTLAPISFDEMAAQSARIAAVTVTSTVPEVRENEHGRFVMTRVRFRVDRHFAGDKDAEFELEFFGGEAGGLAMKIDGVPAFSVGERAVIFATGECGVVCPVAGWSHGVLRIVGGQGEDGAVRLSPPVADALEIGPAGALAPFPEFARALEAKLGDAR